MKTELHEEPVPLPITVRFIACKLEHEGVDGFVVLAFRDGAVVGYRLFAGLGHGCAGVKQAVRGG